MGTNTDPFEGTFDVTGRITEVLVSGIDCDPGFSADFDDNFEGDVFSSEGKLYGEGSGTITGEGGTLPYYAAINDGIVDAEKITASFEIVIMEETFPANVVLKVE